MVYILQEGILPNPFFPISIIVGRKVHPDAYDLNGIFHHKVWKYALCLSFVPFEFWMFSFLFLCFIIINFIIFLYLSKFILMGNQDAFQFLHISFRRILSIHVGYILTTFYLLLQWEIYKIYFLTGILYICLLNFGFEKEVVMIK